MKEQVDIAIINYSLWRLENECLKLDQFKQINELVTEIIKGYYPEWASSFNDR